ncbi:MAG: ankyrin repeat domain-containing protein [Acidobacteria bacterium]|nr:ankyrin repeat domain-containing protein [Acidobacteriota bacterium]
MTLHHLPYNASLDQYQQQAAQLLAAHHAADPEAIDLFHHCHPRFLDDKVVWLPKDLPEGEIENAGINLADAQLALARWYDFRDWQALTEYVDAVIDPNSPVARFEAAVEAVVNGDAATLTQLLQTHPELIRARSTRIMHFDPPLHEATLLHYIAANGVEGHRQKTPANAVEIARILLEAGAEPDALAGMYGGRCTTMSMLVSSGHPAEAGLQAKLAETLLDYGASINEMGSGNWQSPLMTALVFGYQNTAETLVRRGASVETLDAAAALGRLAGVERLFASASAETRHRAIALSAQLGHTDVLRFLLDAGEDPNRYNPPGTHAHSTPLHQAICAGHLDTVKLLVERGARLDVPDTIYKSTPIGWASYLKKTEIENYLHSVKSRSGDSPVGY